MDPLARLPPEVSDWREAIERIEPPERWEFGAALLREWIEGRLEHRLVDDPAGLTPMRIALAHAVEPIGELDLEWGGPNVDENMARRWCWIKSWILTSQDEDLFLMGDGLVVPLLEEAAAGCPKRTYALAIVAHHLRDQAHAALRAGWPAARTRIAACEDWLPAVRSADAPEIAAWLERVIGYLPPRRIDRDEAETRVRDLWRCSPPRELVLEEVAGGWRATIGITAPGKAMVVEAKTGAVRIGP